MMTKFSDCVLILIVALQLSSQAYGRHLRDGSERKALLRRDYDDDCADRTFEDLENCLSVSEKYIPYFEDQEGSTAYRDSGINQTCRDLLKSSTCAVDTINKCPEAEYRTVTGFTKYRMELDLNKYMCLERVEDFTKHWNCFTNGDVEHGFYRKNCWQNFATNECNVEAVAQCIVDIANQTGDCQPGSEGILRGYTAIMATHMAPFFC